MAIIDLRTILISFTLTDIVSFFVIVMLWHQSRDRFAGSTLLIFDYILQIVALILIGLRGAIPLWVSTVMANSMALIGALLGYMWLERFTSKKSSQIHNYLLLVVFAAVHSYFTFIKEDLSFRTLNISIAMLIIFFQCSYLMLYRVPKSMRTLTLNVGVVFFAYCVINLFRILAFFIISDHNTDYFHSNSFESIVLISYQLLFIFLTYSLVLMYNKSLIIDITAEEEKFSKAFNSSPYAITLTRQLDYKIIEVNEGFLSITGYKSSEVIGKTDIDLNLWEREGDRVTVLKELNENGKVYGHEFRFRKKSGEYITGLYSVEIITLNNEKCILSSINDITERKYAEEALRVSEKRYRSLFTEILEAFALHEVIIDEKGMPVNYRFLEVNPSFEKQTGIKANDIIGKTVLDVLPNIESEWIRRYGRVAKTGEPIVFESYTKELDKHYQVVAYSPQKGQFATLFFDITERKKLEIEQFQLLGIIEKSLNEIYVFDSINLKFEYVNQGALLNLGYSLDEMKLLTPIDIKPLFSISQFRELIEPLLKLEKEILVFETIHRRKNGSEYQVEIHLQLHKTGDKNLFFAVINDITERKRIEKEVYELNAKLELRVIQRTNELELKNNELARMNRLFVGRELRMSELKQKIKYLEEKLKGNV